MNLNLNVSHRALKSNEGFEILSLEGKLLSNGVLLARSGLLPFRHVLHQKFNALKVCPSMEFPRDANRLASIESTRAGGEVKISV